MSSSREYDLFQLRDEEAKAASDAYLNAEPNDPKLERLKEAKDDAKDAADRAVRVYLASRAAPSGTFAKLFSEFSHDCLCGLLNVYEINFISLIPFDMNCVNIHHLESYTIALWIIKHLY